MWLYIRVMSPNGTDGMANSVDPDQTIWSGSALFAQTCLSKIMKITVHYFFIIYDLF